MRFEAAARKISLQFTSTAEVVPLVTDPGKFRQIVTNLLGNALKFTESGGVELALDMRDSVIELRVRDTGCGIPPDRIEDMFAPFTQLDGSTTRAKGGTGLGLTVARRLARLMGGDLTAKSKPRGGSTFTLHLPHSTDTGSTLLRPDSPYETQVR